MFSKRKQLLRIFALIKERLHKDNEFTDKSILNRIDSILRIYHDHSHIFIWTQNSYDEIFYLETLYLKNKTKYLSNKYFSYTLQEIMLDSENIDRYLEDLKSSTVFKYLSEENLAIYNSLINKTT